MRAHVRSDLCFGGADPLVCWCQTCASVLMCLRVGMSRMTHCAWLQFDREASRPPISRRQRGVEGKTLTQAESVSERLGEARSGKKKNDLQDDDSLDRGFDIGMQKVI